MSPDEKITDPVASVRRRARRYRRIGGLVLLVGVVGARVVYWRGTRAADLSADPSLVGYNRGEVRQMEILYGTQGELVEELTSQLQQPGTQAFLIVIAAALVAAGSFYFARLLEEEAAAAESAALPHDRSAPPDLPPPPAS